MQLSALLVFLAVPLVAFANFHGDPDIRMGTCPTPAPAHDADEQDWTGRWLGLCTNSEAQVNDRRCLEIKVTYEDDGAKTQIHFNGPTGVETIRHRKLEAIEDQPGRYASSNRTADGSYVSNGWVYTAIAFHGNTVLEFACYQEGDHYRSLYRAFARSLPVSEETKAALAATYAASGDPRGAHFYKHDNCQYKLA